MAHATREIHKLTPTEVFAAKVGTPTAAGYTCK
jgi:hypothetical protein